MVVVAWIPSFVVGLISLYRATQETAGRKMRFVILGIVLLLFTAFNVMQIVNGA